MICFSVHALLNFVKMDNWDNYCQFLEKWVEEKYKNINQVRTYFQNCLEQRERFNRSQILARQKYESEMQQFYSSYNNARNTQNFVARPRGICNLYF